MSKKTTLLLFVSYFTVFASVANASDLGYKTGELFVRFAPKPDGKQRTLAEQNDILFSVDCGNVKHSYKLVPGLTVVKLPPGKTVGEALTIFKKSGGILYAEPNYRLKAISTFPNDPNFGQLWGMHNIGQTGGTEDADIDAPQAWDIATGGSDIIVAVIDSGVDYTHPDLADNMWINEAEANGIPGVDDDGNGYVDDVYGYDFCTYDDYLTDPDPMDDNFHGTHCAGIISAIGDNGEGVAGICWNIRIMALKFLDSGGGGLTNDAIDCIEYAVEMGADVLSNSWGGGGYSDSLKNAIEAANSNGILFVAAAGNPLYFEDPNNDTSPRYPASYDCNNIIAVMATDQNDQRSIWPVYYSSSAYGPTSVDIGAPGTDILSTFPTYETSAMSDYGFSTNYETISGTSMAAPHVAGACALVWRMNPALSHLDVKDILLQTVDKTLPDLCVSEGRLNLYNALAEAGIQAGKQAVILNKIDDVNGPVLPGDYITYTISFENTVRGPNDANFPFGDLTNVTIVDHLPREVDYINPFDPNYDYNEHTYTWNIGTLQEDDSDSVELTVIVNTLAEPLGKITNVCVIEANEICPKTAIAVTDVNCWNPGIIYVDIYDVAGDNTGMSWEHAYTDLQEAMYRARKCGCEQIWVAEGKYKPTKGSNRSISFELVDNVALYGGFPPGGGAWTQRNPNVYETILSGDIAEPNDHSDNSYHVVKCENVYNAILDGFTITAGNADALGYADFNSCGGGIYGNYSLSSTIANCKFSYNSAFYGGALYDSNFSDVNITNCIFAGNTAKYYGGGIYNYQSSPALTNCAFSENHAVGYTVGYATYCGNGGGIANYQSSPKLINCTFSGNSALVSSGNHGDGGAIYNTYGSSPTITYCILSSNLADANGGGLYNESSDPNIANCIFSGNKANLDGGGVFNTSFSPKITNCIFTANDANMGGGLFNTSSSPNMTNSITNCIFVGNTADSYGGGIANYDNSSLVLTNCTFSGNWAHYGGGIFSLNYADANLTNCIFCDNIAGTNGNEIYNDGTSTLNVNYSDVKGGWSGGIENINEDPCFFIVEQPDGSWTEDATYDSSAFQSTLTDSGANWAVNELAGKFVNPYVDLYDCLQFFIVSNDVNTIKVWSDVTAIALTGKTYQIYDYHLKLESACIDAGDPDFNPDPNATDIDGEPRVFDGDANGSEIVDMGADEYYWSPADINSDGFVNFFDYAFFASAWQSDPNDNNYNEDCDLEDNNSIDYNDIALFCEDWLWQTAWAKAFPFAYGQTMGRGMGQSMGVTEEIYPSAPPKQAQPQLTEADIEEILKWLDELWLTDEEVRKMISEDDWLKFMEAVIQAAKELIYN